MKKKKLGLNKVTLRDLDTATLEGIAGAGPTDITSCGSCPGEPPSCNGCNPTEITTCGSCPGEPPSCNGCNPTEISGCGTCPGDNCC
jgi:hypothetical protein